MDNCFAACGCDDYEGVTKSDLDRFTDKIENVLNDDKGRRLFRNFMYTSKMTDGRRALDFWEHIDRLLNYEGKTQTISLRSYLREIDRLMNQAERIEELDLATMERLATARDAEDREMLVEALKIMKVETTKALKREYSAFRIHFIPKK